MSDNKWNILVFNCGSSSLTVKVFEVHRDQPPKTVLSGKCHRVGVKGSAASFVEYHWDGGDQRTDVPLRNHAEAAGQVLTFLEEGGWKIDAVGHRFVHGGSHFTGSVFVDERTRGRLFQCLPLAPIHNPISLSVIREARRHLRDIPHYVTFDSAFHSTIPARAHTYPLPRRIVRTFGFRKFGFHGLSYSYVSGVVSERLARRGENLRVVACHLGTGGSSVCAIEDGKSIDTSMGYSPLPGLVMSTRCGDIDPMLTICLMHVFGYRPDDLLDMLNRTSGLLGVSEFSSDITDIVHRLAKDEDQAELAFGMYVHRLRKYIGAYIAALGGIDALVFTDDIGVRNGLVRERVCDGLAWCGLKLDAGRNESVPLDAITVVSTADSEVEVLTVPTEEELVICREGIRLLEAN